MDSQNIINFHAKSISEHEADLFKILYECNCCPEHNKGKPVNLYAGYTPNYLKEYKVSNKKCKCPCRHTMRKMARFHNYNPWYRKEEQQKQGEEQQKQGEEQNEIKNNLSMHGESRWEFDRPGWHNY